MRPSVQVGLPDDYESEVLIPFKEFLIQHISRSLQFFYSSSSYNFIDQLFLVGGVSAIEGLVTDVEASLSVPTEVANLLANMQINPSINRTALTNDGPAMMLAVGLALRSFQ